MKNVNIKEKVRSEFLKTCERLRNKKELEIFNHYPGDPNCHNMAFAECGLAVINMLDIEKGINEADVKLIIFRIVSMPQECEYHYENITKPLIGMYYRDFKKVFGLVQSRLIK